MPNNKHLRLVPEKTKPYDRQTDEDLMPPPADASPAELARFELDPEPTRSLAVYTDPATGEKLSNSLSPQEQAKLGNTAVSNIVSFEAGKRLVAARKMFGRPNGNDHGPIA